MGGIKLDRIPLNGRSLDEYLAIFGLDVEGLAGKSILDIGAGPSSFAMEAGELGAQVVATDPAYAIEPATFHSTALAQIANIRKNIEPVIDSYRWDYYKDPDDLRLRRERVLESFMSDFSTPKSHGAYVAGSLPRIPFKDASFDLVLCSHLLFLFADRLPHGFHFGSLLEMTRISRGGALVYPLVGLDGKPYPHMDRLRLKLEENGISVELFNTDFEFLKGADQVMRVSKRQ